MPYIYVLHFDTKLSHAEHYIGTCKNLRARIERHADGAGSRLTRELIKQGIAWRLGGLYEVTMAQSRRLERKLKDQHNSRRYCQVCNLSEQASFNGTRPIDIDNVRFPTLSSTIQAAPRTGQTVHRIVCPADRQLIEPQIKSLMTADKDALGFIPCGGEQGLQHLFALGQIAVAMRENQLLSYAAFTARLQKEEQEIKIQQCCTADPERLVGHGATLISLIAEKHPNASLQAKVRNDLAANEFWKAIGFDFIGDMKHKTSGSTLNVYKKKGKDNGTV